MIFPDKTAGIKAEESKKEAKTSKKANAFLVREQILAISGSRKAPRTGMKVIAKSIRSDFIVNNNQKKRKKNFCILNRTAYFVKHNLGLLG